MKKNLLIISIGLILGISIGYYMLISEQQVQRIQTSTLLLLGVLGIVVAYLNTVISSFLDKNISWKKNEGLRLFSGIVIHFAITFLASYFACYAYANAVGNITDFYEYKLSFIKLGILLCIVIILFQVIYFALYSYYSYVTLQIEAVKLERNQIEHQFEALKSQLSPHFLFNGLNTISSLTHKDKTKASLFVRKLALMYHYVLKSYSVKLTNLEKEITLVESYNYLISNRFSGRYNYEISISPDILKTHIPPLSIQMLVENAVKHNVMSNEHPLEVKITNDEDFIYIKNNITSKPKNINSFKIGLKNINSRYLLLTKKNIEVTNGENFLVKLPIIR